MRVAGSLFALVLVACASPSAPGASIVSSRGDGSAAASGSPAPQAAAPPVKLERSWSSSGCGRRMFQRRIDLNWKNAFVATDFVAPADGGPVKRSGTWAVEGEGVTLTVAEGPPSSPGGFAFPTRLIWDARFLYLGNLPYDATVEEVTKLLVPIAGNPERVFLPLDGDGRKRGFANVTVASSEAARKVFEKLQGADVRGRVLVVERIMTLVDSRGEDAANPTPCTYTGYSR